MEYVDKKGLNLFNLFAIADWRSCLFNLHKIVCICIWLLQEGKTEVKLQSLSQIKAPQWKKSMDNY